MPLRSDARDVLSIVVYLLRWTLLVLPIGLLVGSACARRRTKGRPGTRWRKILGSQPLYQDLIAAAKGDGILHATAHNSFHGYSGGRAIEADRSDAPNPRLTLCIELIDQRAKLEAFCRAHGDLLKGHVMVYKHVEHWDIHDGIMEEHDATPDEFNEAVSEG
jgi:PII-like signaling protein